MKILHVSDFYRPLGGTERLLFGTLEGLEALGHENVVVTDRSSRRWQTGRRSEHFLEHLDTSEAYGKTLVELLARSKMLCSEIKRIIREHAPNVAHIHAAQNPFVIRALTQSLPCVRSVHDPKLYCFTDWRLLPNGEICRHPLGRSCVRERCVPLNPFRKFHRTKKILFRLWNLGAHRDMPVLIAESRAMRDCLFENGFPEKQIAFLPNFTDIPGSWEEISSFNQRFHRAGGRTVLFVGRSSPEKGIEMLLDAMALVPRPWKLILVTGGPYLPAVRKKIEALRLEQWVEIPGVLDYADTRTYYARADVVVIPSVWIEPFALVGLEAMANGKPVVGFQTGGIPDWLDDGRTGFLVPLKNTPALAEKITCLLDDQKLARQMGRAGYERVSSEYNRELYLTRLLEIYGSANG